MLHFVLPLINLIVPVIHSSFHNFMNPLSGIVSRRHKIHPLPTYYVGRETFLWESATKYVGDDVKIFHNKPVH